MIARFLTASPSYNMLLNWEKANYKERFAMLAKPRSNLLARLIFSSSLRSGIVFHLVNRRNILPAEV